MRSNSPYPVRSSPYTSHSTRSSPNPRPPSRAVLTGDCGLRPSADSSVDENEPLLGPNGSLTMVYTRRWYLLLLFSLVSLLQILVWATWGPISQSAEAALNWGDSDITMCVWMGNLPFALLCIPFAWLMDRKGLRVSLLLTCFFMTSGAGLRCLLHFLPSSYTVWCVYGGQWLNGMAGPVAQGGGALFSNLWFPNNQRATSTALSTFIGYMGSALAFVLGPTLVPNPFEDPSSNSTLPDGNDTFQMLFLSDDDNSTVTTDYTLQRDGILSYLYYQAAAAAVVFLLVLLYFPDKPPKPPSLSAAAEREEFQLGLVSLVRNKQFWLISSAFCLSLGVFEVWDVVLDVNLSFVGITQEEAGWLGFYCVLAGCVAGLAICRLADIFFRHIRLFLILSYVVSAVFVLWFILIYINILPFDMVSIYAAIILSGVFLDGCSPLVYELVCEAAYPVGEGVSSCFLQMLFVLAGIAFTSVQQIPNIGTTWMNWCLLGTICTAVPLLCCVTETYGRADLDAVGEQVVVVQPPDNPSTQRDCRKDNMTSANTRHNASNMVDQHTDIGVNTRHNTSYLTDQHTDIGVNTRHNTSYLTDQHTDIGVNTRHNTSYLTDQHTDIGAHVSVASMLFVDSDTNSRVRPAVERRTAQFSRESKTDQSLTSGRRTAQFSRESKTDQSLTSGRRNVDVCRDFKTDKTLASGRRSVDVCREYRTDKTLISGRRSVDMRREYRTDKTLTSGRRSVDMCRESRTDKTLISGRRSVDVCRESRTDKTLISGRQC